MENWERQEGRKRSKEIRKEREMVSKQPSSTASETGTPNLHRATIAQQRVRMEGWRQRRLGSMGTIWKKKKIKKRKKQKNERKALTLTGLLMEGLTPLLPSGRPLAQSEPSMEFARHGYLACLDFL
jgi:hypothetical protein